MRCVGIDLAWGERAPTGVAVLDGEGRLLLLSRATGDDTIVEALAASVNGDCVVGIDAPLIVTDAAGSRPCEAALTRDFGRFDAGTRPANARKTESSGVPRGARVAARLGLDLASASPRRAIEVSPHAAMVALFRLGRTLKYKQRSGRPFRLMQAETLRLIALLESLEHASPPLHLDPCPAWQALVDHARRAERKSELRRAEDQLDAIVCAYVALLAARRPDALTTYGDAATGCIVTPTLPAGLLPTPRGSVPTGQEAELTASTIEPAQLVSEAVSTYVELKPHVDALARRLATWLTSVLDDAGINYLDVGWRGKSVASFAAKMNKATADGSPLYPEPLRDITDQIGVRVITFVTSDVAAVADLVADQLRVIDDKDLGQATANEGRFGYTSRHLQVALDPAWLSDLPLGDVRVASAQIQLRTVLQHAWAEFEHDIRYKGTIPDALAPDLDRRFALAAGLLELADREFQVIRDRLSLRMSPGPTEADASDPRIGHEEMAAFLATHYPDAGWSRTDHYTWMAGLLLELGITSLRELDGLLPAVDSPAITDRMGYRYPPGAVRRLDDALLAVFGERYVGLHGNAHRVALLGARLEKLRGAVAATTPGRVQAEPAGRSRTPPA